MTVYLILRGTTRLKLRGSTDLVLRGSGAAPTGSPAFWFALMAQGV